MKRFTSILSALILTLAMSQAALAGNITLRTGNITLIAGNITLGNVTDDETSLLSVTDITSVVVATIG